MKRDFYSVSVCQSNSRFYNLSIFKSTFLLPIRSQSNFLQRIRFWSKIVSRKSSFAEFYSKRSFFLSVLTTETSKLTFLCFLENFYSQKDALEKYQILNQTFREESDFDSIFLQSVQFWMEKFETCQILCPFSKTR